MRLSPRPYPIPMYLVISEKKRNDHLNVGGVSIRSTNGAPPGKGRVVNGQMSKCSPSGPDPAPTECVDTIILCPHPNRNCEKSCVLKKRDDIFHGQLADVDSEQNNSA